MFRRIVTSAFCILLASCGQASHSTSKLANSNSVGNGGGAWVCWNDRQESGVDWIQMVDLYEAEREFQWTLAAPVSSDFQEIVRWLRLRTLEADAEFYQKIAPHLDRVLDIMQLVDANLGQVDDANYRIHPSPRECAGIIGERPAQLANYTHDGRLIVNQYLFNSPLFSARDRAALVYHEAIYAYLREAHGHKTSDTTRRLVGAIFSTLDRDTLKDHLRSWTRYPGGGDGSTAVGMTFVKIPKGTFLMGSPSSESGRHRDETQHRVTITYDFFMQTTEVTQEQWFKVMGDNPSQFIAEQDCPGEYKQVSGIALCPNNPVEKVSWHDAQLFINKMNERRDGFRYRLPTEAEWEYAARGGSTGPYSVAGNPADFAWFDGNSGGMTHAVAKLRPNAYGLYDVHGNVWEWVSDWYGDYPSSNVTDPVGASSGSLRVIRGGSWGYSAQDCRSAFRFNWRPDGRFSNLGFRLLRMPSP